MKLILNEINEVKDSLENGVIDSRKPTNTVRLLAKYYNTLGKSEQQIIDDLEAFMSKNFPNYVKVLWEDLIENIAKQAIKADRPLVNVNEVYVYEAEVEFIQSLENEKIQKLVFTYLIYAKIFNQINPLNNDWVAGKHRSEIFKDANVADTGTKQLYLLHDLIKEDILYTAKSITNNSLNVGNYISKDGEVALTITDFRQLGLQWLLYIGTKGIGKCDECGVLFKHNPKAKKKAKVCKECAKNIDNSSRNNRKR
jgi:hypothetical protein